MTHRVRPDVVVFDVVETLAGLDPVAARLRECHQPEELLARWFTRLVRDGMALTAAGSYAGFAEVAASALHAELGTPCRRSRSATSSPVSVS